MQVVIINVAEKQTNICFNVYDKNWRLLVYYLNQQVAAWSLKAPTYICEK